MNIRLALFFFLCVVLSASNTPSAADKTGGLNRRAITKRNDEAPAQETALAVTDPKAPEIAEAKEFARKLTSISTGGWIFSNLVSGALTIALSYYGGQQCLQPSVNEHFLTRIAGYAGLSSFIGGFLSSVFFYVIGLGRMELAWEFSPIFMVNFCKAGVLARIHKLFSLNSIDHASIFRHLMQISELEVVMVLSVLALKHFKYIS